MIELRPCKCGCGEMVKGTWKRGHAMRARTGYKPPEPLPGPDDELPDIDLGEAIPDPGPDIPDWVNWKGPVSPGEAPPPPVADQSAGHAGQGHFSLDDEIAPDPEPAHLGDRGRRSRGFPPKGKTRITAAVQKDIAAKVTLMVEIPGRVWQARDPVCGGTWMHQSGDISDALTAIVLDSPDLVAWFTGPAGGFMKYLNLVMALQPVALTVWAHHIAHSITIEPAQPAPGADARASAQAYAA